MTRASKLEDAVDLAMTTVNEIQVAAQRLLHGWTMAEMRQVMVKPFNGFYFGLKHYGPIGGRIINHDAAVQEAILLLH